MKKIDGVSWTIIICMLCIAVAGLFFMPNEIDVQWNENGVSSTATKWVVFAFPFLAALLTIVRRAQSPYHLGGTFFAGVLILFAVEIIIVGNSAGIFKITKVDINLGTKIAGILLGCFLIYFGNKLPKIARNYYYGIKTPWAVTDDNLWTKTQRVAGKTWFLVGLVIVLLTFAPAYVQSSAIALGALILFTVPRLYSKHLVDKKSQ